MTKQNFFYFIYRKLIGDDIETVRYMLKQSKEGKPILDPEKKRIFFQSMKDAPKTLIKESWPWLVAIVFVALMGYLVGLEKCEVECHNFIVENYEECMYDSKYSEYSESPVISPKMSIFPSNPGDEEGKQEYQPIDNISYP